MTISPPGLSVVGLGEASADGPGLIDFVLFVPQGLPVNFVGGLLAADVAKLAERSGTTTTGGGSGIVTTDADGTATDSGGRMFDCTTKNATPPVTRTNTSMTNASVFLRCEPSSSGGGEIRSPLAIPDAVVGEPAAGV